MNFEVTEGLRINTPRPRQKLSRQATAEGFP